MFGGKGGALQAEEHHSNRETPGWQHHAAGATGALHKMDGIMDDNYLDILKQHLKTSVKKLKLGRKWVFQMDNDPKHTCKVKVLEWPSQSPQTHRTFVGRTIKAAASKEAYKSDSVTPALSGGMGQNSPNLLWEACGSLPEMFDPS